MNKDKEKIQGNAVKAILKAMQDAVAISKRFLLAPPKADLRNLVPETQLALMSLNIRPTSLS